jgi:hypothetical protein
MCPEPVLANHCVYQQIEKEGVSHLAQLLILILLLPQLRFELQPRLRVLLEEPFY